MGLLHLSSNDWDWLCVNTFWMGQLSPIEFTWAQSACGRRWWKPWKAHGVQLLHTVEVLNESHISQPTVN